MEPVAVVSLVAMRVRMSRGLGWMLGKLHAAFELANTNQNSTVYQSTDGAIGFKVALGTRIAADRNEDAVG